MHRMPEKPTSPLKREELHREAEKLASLTTIIGRSIVGGVPGTTTIGPPRGA